MNKEKTAIDPWLLWPFLVVPALGFGLLNLPFSATQTMGNEGYLGVPIAALLTLPGIAAIYLLARRFPGLSIIEYGNSILGPVLGRITGLVYLGFGLLLLAVFMRDQINMVGSYLLDQTPLYVMLLVVSIPTAYFASRGLETISRLASFVLLPSVLVMSVLIVTGFQNVSPTHLLPLGDLKPLQYLDGGRSVSYIFYLLGTAAMVLPFLKPLRSFPRVAGGTVLLLTIFYLAFTIGAIGVYSHHHLLRFSWPSLEFVHAIEYPYLLLEQAGLLMLISWLTVFFVATQVLSYTTALGCSQLTGAFDYKIFTWMLLPVQFFLTMLPGNVQQTKYFFHLIADTGWIVYFAYPIGLLLVAVLFRRKGRADA
jgi:spore germination protein